MTILYWGKNTLNLDRHQRDMSGVDQHLAGVLEIDGDAVADRRLHLAETPVGPARMADEHARKHG